MLHRDADDDKREEKPPRVIMQEVAAPKPSQTIEDRGESNVRVNSRR